MYQSAPRFPFALMWLVVALSSASLPAQAPNAWIQDVNWLFLGPLENPAGCDPQAAVQNNWIAPEEISTIAPADGDPIDIDFTQAASSSWQGVGDAPAWSCLANLGQPPNDLVDLLQITSLLTVSSGKTIASTNTMAVFVTYVESSRTQPLPVSVCTASDDSLQVYVNDQKVQE